MINLASNNNNNNPNNRMNLNNNRNTNGGNQRENLSFRNELYDRTSGYDVPRQLMRNGNNNNYPPNAGAIKRRTNLNLDINSNRPRYINTNRAYRQRSFDDTESYHYAHNNNNFRYENIYEQIHEEPAYRNVGMATNSNGARLYGRLDVIGHGIGRIERHLSSSCGNIDHYNLGGHYAVLGHSHLGTVGHIRLNATNAPSNTKETAGKGLNFFSCLGRENSQSMSNICRASTTGNNTDNNNPPTVQNPIETSNKPTGAIPKLRNKVAPKATNPPPIHSTSFNRIPKSSLQWLLVNKWLPLWVGGTGSDCNVVDFNFMFSRNCEGCGNDSAEQQPATMRFYNNRNNENGCKEYHNTSERQSEGSLRPMRFRENDRRYIHREGSLDDRVRVGRTVNNFGMHTLPQNYESDYARENVHRNYRNNRQHHANRNEPPLLSDPFRQWELNSENNSFRPAIRRITDGTFPHNIYNHNQIVRVEINHHSPDAPTPTAAALLHPKPSTSNANTNLTLNKPSQRDSNQMSSVKIKFENNTLSSSTESTSATQDNKNLSPDLSARRYSENTEDDQESSCKSLSRAENDDSVSDVDDDDTEQGIDNNDDRTEDNNDSENNACAVASNEEI